MSNQDFLFQNKRKSRDQIRVMGGTREVPEDIDQLARLQGEVENLIDFINTEHREYLQTLETAINTLADTVEENKAKIATWAELFNEQSKQIAKLELEIERLKIECEPFIDDAK